ncbi:Peroxisomal membrane protein 11-1 [Dichanthelium oligosanthes]|uniref:Peroxisomal membrane protein 11-1 n=1 Tax=Dichanthelium oligosanthes TaxID=888268 RepID=A0A1E5WJF0_9POAL|nr:Peroxisomal membrane protein 11-1 [Dichanthelium oligosanthes]
MCTLDATRAELGLVVLYLNKAEARDKICRAIQYGSKFISNGQPGTAQDVDKSTTLARKVFRLLKWVNDLHALISPPAKGTPLTLVLLGKSKNALLSTFLFLDQFVWLGRTGIIKLGELKRLSKSMRKLARELRDTDKYENEQYQNKMKQSDERLLALVKAAMDVVVAIGLLQLAPKKITPRVTGAFGFITSLISCYQQLPSRAPVAKVKV